MEVVTINILVKHQPLNEEQVRDERLVSLLPDELVGFAEERREMKRSKELINNLQYLIGHYIYCVLVVMLMMVHTKTPLKIIQPACYFYNQIIVRGFIKASPMLIINP